MEWCGEGGTHFLVELALRSSVATSLRDRDAAGVWGYHAELGTFIQSPGELAPQQLNWRGGARGGGRGKVKGVNAKVHIMESGKKGGRRRGKKYRHTHTLVGTT